MRARRWAPRLSANGRQCVYICARRHICISAYLHICISAHLHICISVRGCAQVGARLRPSGGRALRQELSAAAQAVGLPPGTLPNRRQLLGELGRPDLLAVRLWGGYACRWL